MIGIGKWSVQSVLPPPWTEVLFPLLARLLVAYLEPGLEPAGATARPGLRLLGGGVLRLSARGTNHHRLWKKVGTHQVSTGPRSS